MLPKNVNLEKKRNGKISSSVSVSFFRREVSVEKVIDCGRSSLLKKLVRVPGFVLRLVHNLKPFLGRCEVTKEDLLFEEIVKSK